MRAKARQIDRLMTGNEQRLAVMTAETGGRYSR
jgi:hypothetical protein